MTDISGAMPQPGVDNQEGEKQFRRQSDLERLADFLGSELVAELSELSPEERTRYLRIGSHIVETEVELEQVRKENAMLRAENEALKEDVDTLEARSVRDDLTGLLNKKAFESVGEVIVNDTKESDNNWMIMMDVSGFKAVNDLKGGHLTGDGVLEQIGGILQSSLVRKTDTVGRLGGDEFGIMLQGGNEESTLETLKMLEQNFSVLESFGIKFPFGVWKINPGDDFTTVYKIADQAMYKAKRAIKAHPGTSHAVVVASSENNHGNDRLVLDQD